MLCCSQLPGCSFVCPLLPVACQLERLHCTPQSWQEPKTSASPKRRHQRDACALRGGEWQLELRVFGSSLSNLGPQTGNSLSVAHTSLRLTDARLWLAFCCLSWWQRLMLSGGQGSSGVASWADPYGSRTTREPGRKHIERQTGAQVCEGAETGEGGREWKARKRTAQGEGSQWESGRRRRES